MAPRLVGPPGECLCGGGLIEGVALGRHRATELTVGFLPHLAEDLGLGGGGLVGGLLGRAVGGMLRSAVGALGEQLREAQQQAADIQVGGWGLLAGAGAVEAANVPEGWVLDTSEAGRPQAGSRHCAARQHCPFLGPLCLLLQERAARMIENSSKLREQMGGSVQVMPPVSQSSMSSSVNGRSSKTVTLLMPVVGASGRTAQVGPRGSRAGHSRCLSCLLCCVCVCS